MNFFLKFKFFLRKPKVIIVVGKDRIRIKRTICQILRHPKIEKDILTLEAKLDSDSEAEELKWVIKSSKLPILVIDHIRSIPFHFAASDKEEKRMRRVEELAKQLPRFGCLIANLDDEKIRKIKVEPDVKEIGFGFEKGVDLRATDIYSQSGINFKVNYQGSFVPVWLEGASEKEQIYSALAAIAVGVILGLNLVEISQILKGFPFSTRYGQ
ncbi:hypothetical protein J7J18_01280 [bacterium]|nr:hypothetical protein [bacterium]